MGNGGEGGSSAAVVHGDDHFVDQFGGVRADADGAQNFSGFTVSEHFDKAIGFPHDHAFAVVIEGVAGGDERNLSFFQIRLIGADNRHLGMGKDAKEEEAVVHMLFDGVAENEAMCVSGGYFALLNGNVDDVQRAAHVPGGKNVRLAGLHGAIDGNFAFNVGDMRVLKPEAGSGWVAPQGDQNLIDGDAVLFRAVAECDAFLTFG